MAGYQVGVVLGGTPSLCWGERARTPTRLFRPGGFVPDSHWEDKPTTPTEEMEDGSMKNPPAVSLFNLENNVTDEEKDGKNDPENGKGSDDHHTKDDDEDNSYATQFSSTEWAK